MINWNKIEKITIYVSLIFIGVITIISSVFPILIPKEVIEPVTTALVTLSLLSLFKYISNKLESPEDITRNTFIDSTKQLFDKIKTKKIKTLDLFAYTGRRYKEIVHDNKIEIENARLLFTKGNKSKSYKKELEDEVNFWRKKVTGNLEIKFYDFELSIYFCIIDNDYFNYGLMLPFRPTDVDWLRNAYMINRKETEQLIISDFKDFFDYVFEISSSDFLETE